MEMRSGSFGWAAFSATCLAEAVGSSSGMEWVITGMVIMNTISNTSITSTSGVTLMSAMGESSPLFIEPKAILLLLIVHNLNVQIVGVGIHILHHLLIAEHDKVVGQHGGDGGKQADGGGHQCFADGAGHGGDVYLAL